MKGLRVLFFVLIGAAVVFAGCASRKVVKKTPQPQDTQTKAEVEEPTPQQGMKYVVKEGDSLWSIASNGNIYEDPFQWPLLFKSNRDQVEDPDLIYPDQELDVKKDFSSSEVSDAVQKAKDTPKYSAHTAPRKKLPLRY